jgi:hypothetical protein
MFTAFANAITPVLADGYYYWGGRLEARSRHCGDGALGSPPLSTRPPLVFGCLRHINPRFYTREQPS